MRVQDYITAEPCGETQFRLSQVSPGDFVESEIDLVLDVNVREISVLQEFQHMRPDYQRAVSQSLLEKLILALTPFEM